MQPNFKTITALKETRQGRMAVFFDDTFDFSVDEETLLRHKLKVGQKFTPAQYEQLKSETQYQKAREKAFSLLSYKSFTRKQLGERLARDFSEDCVEDVLDRLEELGLINDADYALRCARDLFSIKHYAPTRVRQELAVRGIDRNDIEDVMEEFSDFDEQQAIAQILERKYASSLKEEKGRRRAFAALMRVGYEPDDIRSQISVLLSRMQEEAEESKEEESLEERDIEEEIRTLLLKKYKSVLGEQKGKDRAIRGLMRKGYHYEEIRRVLENLLEEEESE